MEEIMKELLNSEKVQNELESMHEDALNMCSTLTDKAWNNLKKNVLRDALRDFINEHLNMADKREELETLLLKEANVQ